MLKSGYRIKHSFPLSTTDPDTRYLVIRRQLVKMAGRDTQAFSSFPRPKGEGENRLGGHFLNSVGAGHKA